MPRYFFNVIRPVPELDADGSELANIGAARAAAVRLCGEMIREIDGTFWRSPFWQLEVKGHDHRLLFTLTFAGEDHEEAD